MVTENFSRRETSVVIILGAIAAGIPALQPFLLGSILEEGRISALVMGRASAAEAFGMVIGTAAAGASGASISKTSRPPNVSQSRQRLRPG